jgi:hypothetical protein
MAIKTSISISNNSLCLGVADFRLTTLRAAEIPSRHAS